MGTERGSYFLTSFVVLPGFVCKKVPGLEPYLLAYVLVYFRLYRVNCFYISILRDSLLQENTVDSLLQEVPLLRILPFTVLTFGAILLV